MKFDITEGIEMGTDKIGLYATIIGVIIGIIFIITLKIITRDKKVASLNEAGKDNAKKNIFRIVKLLGAQYIVVITLILVGVIIDFLWCSYVGGIVLIFLIFNTILGLRKLSIYAKHFMN